MPPIRPSSSPFWADGVAPPNLPVHENQIESDVLVIGAGFTGLRSAICLAEAGASVTVLDSGAIGTGASGRNGGQVNPMLPHNTPSKLRSILGPVYFERLAEASLTSADALFEFANKWQIDCDARQNGWLRVCHNERALREARENADAWNTFGAGMEVVGQKDVVRLSGSGAYQSGIVTPKGGAVHPLKLAVGMARVAIEQGAHLFGHSAVLSLSHADGKWIANTAQGQVNANTVIVATNGYTGDLIPDLAQSLLPLTPIQMATTPLPDQIIGDILPDGHTISDSRRIIMYARKEPGNRFVFGGLGMPDRQGHLTGFDWLEKDAFRIFPQLRGTTWTHRWGGRIAVTDDHLPHMHEPRPGLLIGLGFNGRGVAMSQIMGKALADRALGKPSDALVFPVTSLKPLPGRSLKLRSLKSLVWLMRLLDYLESR